jgi:hypothetical protein
MTRKTVILSLDENTWQSAAPDNTPAIKHPTVISSQPINSRRMRRIFIIIGFYPGVKLHQPDEDKTEFLMMQAPWHDSFFEETITLFYSS